MIRAKGEDASQLRHILELNEQCSGQMINKSKSAILFSTNTVATRRSEVKGILEVEKETMNERYLGLPVHVGSLRSKIFAYLKDRVWKRIHGWKEKFLS